MVASRYFFALSALILGCGGDAKTTSEKADAGSEAEAGKVSGPCLEIACEGSVLDPDCDGCDGDAYCHAGRCVAPEAGLGERCTSDAQCTPVLAYCDGTCKAYGKNGARCFYDDDGVRALDSAGKWPFGDELTGLERCEVGLRCDAGTERCTDAGTVGKACLSDGTCEGGACDRQTNLCLRTTGTQPVSPCGTCADGTTCDGESKRCLANPGSPCEQTSDCAKGLSCLSGPFLQNSRIATAKLCRYTEDTPCVSGGAGCSGECMNVCAQCVEKQEPSTGGGAISFSAQCADTTP